MIGAKPPEVISPLVLNNVIDPIGKERPPCTNIKWMGVLCLCAGSIQQWLALSSSARQPAFEVLLVWASLWHTWCTLERGQPVTKLHCTHLGLSIGGSAHYCT